VSIQLTKPYGHVPGEDLAFKWNYSKVRHGGHLPEFEARYTLETGWVITDDPRLEEVAKMLQASKSQRAIALALDMSQPTVNRIVKKIRERGLAGLNEKAKPVIQ